MSFQDIARRKKEITFSQNMSLHFELPAKFHIDPHKKKPSDISLESNTEKFNGSNYYSPSTL